MKELGKCECVLSVMTITPVMKVERQKMGAMGILQVIDDVVFVCICRVYSDVFKKYTSRAFVYDSHFHKKRRVDFVVQSLIIDIMHPFVSLKKRI